ncbi:MAG: hypothetical protein MJY56_05900 [Bacteroidales bacterium]|nr:hypothetical protein [Bacteroidales bacterium]
MACTEKPPVGPEPWETDKAYWGTRDEETGEWRMDALKEYWSEDYNGEYGIQVKGMGPGQPRMYLADKLLYVTGVNNFSLFTQMIVETRFLRNNAKLTIAKMKEGSVPVCRFSASPFSASGYKVWFNQKDEYLKNLDSLATWADNAQIGLIPSFFWNPSHINEYPGIEEPLSAFGDVNSKTYQHMVEYTKEVVSVLKRHKSIFAWEFGNELNLGCDLKAETDPNFISADQASIAMKGFAEAVAETDEQKRMISSGNSVMRNSQFHLLKAGNWNTDTYDQFLQILSIFHPSPMDAVSEHIYGEKRVFADKGGLDMDQTVASSKAASAKIGKAYYIGEFTGPKSSGADSLLVRTRYQSFLDNKIQLSLIWNFSYAGDTEASFRPKSADARMVFGMMREFNSELSKVTE